MQMGCSTTLLLVFLSWLFFASRTHQLRSYETQMSIKCEDDSVTELRIVGDKPARVGEFRGFPIPNQTLSPSFSIDSFVTTLTRLSSLRVLSLVSLGIWGSLPDKIHRLSSLEALDMSSNFMFGSIPSEMSRLVKLQTLTFDENFFNDTVPEWLDSLTNLTTLSLKNNRLKGQLLDLRENNLDSELPPLPEGLGNIFLSNNSFSGSIPEQFGKLNHLQHLDLSDNYLSGTPPALLFSLPNISYLNLSSNSLSGSLPEHLKCGDSLSLVDLSDNRLKGQLPNCLGTAAIAGDKIMVDIRGNCFSIEDRDQHPSGYCKDIDKRRSTVKEIAVLAGVIGGIIIIVAFILVIGLLIYCKKHRKQEALIQHIAPKVKQDDPPSEISPELLANARIISQAAKMGNQSALPYRCFSVENWKKPQKTLIPQHFWVYKGRLENGTLVVIRSLALHRKYSIRNLRLRLDLLSKLRHPHLVGLLGHCIDGGMQDDSTIHRLFLVQEFVPNGNFRSHLSETSPEKILKWSDRLAILIGVAKAVHFLHTGVIPPSFSNRLKTNNILLDEHGIAKLSDYGISIITDETEKSEAKGDTTKSGHVEKLQDDVYNFGFILFESLVGPIVSGKGEAFLLNEMTSFNSQDGRLKIVDPIVLTTSSQESLSIVISITNKCISPESSNRPSFEDVLWNLQYAAQVQATADADQKSETTSRPSFS
ncbi:UNVERIFIED_CONTAM: putative inactive leucine-rich repeat receptor-like protein kinase [Sesamum radiatum]|uniref:Inactive leucine-rich repeat receptor-like protein kinase n=1 Tax=Sesamum radiatum TaxID=300843 RepID=A0AAW2RAV1_SESRA